MQGFSFLEALLSSGIVGLVIGLVEVIKWQAKKKDSDGNRSGLTAGEREALFESHKAIEDTCAIVSRTDSDGTPLVYLPRSLARHQEELVETQRRIAYAMETQTRILERIDEELRG